jgi:GTP-binding protein Era
MRFFVSEIVREKILTHYKQEIPYSCEVVVEEFIDEPTICRIRAEIRVARESQKYIVVGAGGRMIKRVGTDSRKELESFLDKKVFLDLYVRVDKDWRNDERKLKRFGYFD